MAGAQLTLRSAAFLPRHGHRPDLGVTIRTGQAGMDGALIVGLGNKKESFFPEASCFERIHPCATEAGGWVRP